MLNANNERELAYVVLIDGIEPITGSDNCECAVIGGWHIMVRKGQFNIGDPAIYFEIDSKVPSTNPAFSFLEKRNYKVKTQKFTFGGKGNFISQGLLMHASDFGWTTCEDEKNRPGICIGDNKGHTFHFADDESRFLTKILGVTYADDEDNQRKAKNIDPNAKYLSMKARHKKFFSNRFVKKMWKYPWFRKLCFFFMGKKKDKPRGFPTKFPFVHKSDEERVENMPFILKDKEPWIATEKIDGTSTTFTMKKHKGIFGTRYEFLVCSRNVVFDKPDKKCFYETNVYTEMAEKYHMEEVLRKLLDEVFISADWVTIQGETFGAGIQKRDYSIEWHDFRAFNLIVSDKGRLNSCTAAELVEPYGIKWVPIVDIYYTLPDTVDELLSYATNTSFIDGKAREGIVFRSYNGEKSFKAVSNEYLMEYHG